MLKRTNYLKIHLFISVLKKKFLTLISILKKPFDNLNDCLAYVNQNDL